MERAHLDKVLSSYVNIGKTMFDKASNASMDDAHGFLRYFLVDMSVVPVLLTFHSFFAALAVYRLTAGKQFWLKSLVLTMFAAFGGSTLASLMCGEPAPLFTTGSNYMVPYVVIAWYIVNHSVPARYVLLLRPVRALVAFGAMAAKSRAIMGFVDKVAALWPDAAVGAVLLGGLSGSGGTLFVSVEKIVQGGLRTNSEFSAPGWGFKSAYLAAFTYYVGADPAGWIRRHVAVDLPFVDRDDMRFVVSMALCTHAALETFYGRHVNPVFFLEEIFFALTGVQKTPEPVETGVDGASVEGEGGDAESSGRTEDGKTGKAGLMANGVRRRAKFRSE